MAFTLQIKQKKLFGKTKLDILTLARSCGFMYGSDDEFLFCRNVRSIVKQLFFIIRTESGEGSFLMVQKVKTGFMR